MGRPVSVTVTATAAPTPAAARRIFLRRRTPRTAELEGIVARYRWVNAGLRERMAELTDQRDELIAALEDATDDTARTLGHLHPAVTSVRAILASVPR